MSWEREYDHSYSVYEVAFMGWRSTSVGRAYWEVNCQHRSALRFPQGLYPYPTSQRL